MLEELFTCKSTCTDISNFKSRCAFICEIHIHAHEHVDIDMDVNVDLDVDVDVNAQMWM